MVQLIDKDAVVAEIKRLIKANELYLSEPKTDEVRFQKVGAYSVLNDLLHFLDTLEVKEVDLDKEIDFVEDKYQGFYSLSRADIIDVARHFFELGLCNTITEEDCKLIWNIGDEIPNMQEEEFFKELLKRYKAQKGE